MKEILNEKKNDSNYFLNDSDNDDNIYIGSSHLPCVAVDLKLLKAALAKITHCHGCGCKKYWDILKIILCFYQAYICEFFTVKKNKDNLTLALLKSSIILFRFSHFFFFSDTILFIIFLFSESLFYRYLLLNVLLYKLFTNVCTLFDTISIF